MDRYGPVAFYFLIPLVVSFMCSLLEAVLLTVSPAYLAIGVKKGSSSAKLLQRMRRRIDRPLAAILTFNTIAQTVGAAGMGAHVLATFGSASVAFASALMTFLLLVFAELIPKKLGFMHWRRLAAPAPYLIYVLIVVSYPIVLISEAISNLVARAPKPIGVTREEVIETAEIGASEGHLKRKESHLIRNILNLNQVHVTDIMTPRNEIRAIEELQTVGDVMQRDRQLRFSRLPVYRGDLDHIVGVIHRYLILEAYSRDRDRTPLRQLIKPISRISKTLSVAQVLEEFIQRREHIFIVTGNQGKTLGLVTFDDAIETLLGAELGEQFESVSELRRTTIEQWKRLRVRPLESVSENTFEASPH